MRVLQLKFLTEKGRLAINKQNEKNKKDTMMLWKIRATGGKLIFIDGGMQFSHFIFKSMTGDLNSPGNAQSDRLKRQGFEAIVKALEKDDCLLDTDYNIKFVEV